MVLGFDGSTYKGSMYNPEPNMHTVESDIVAALLKTKLIPNSNSNYTLSNIYS